MNPLAHDMKQLIGEHCTLLRSYGQAQLRCSELLRAQAAEIDSLHAQTIRLRAAFMVRDTALAWAPEHRGALQTAASTWPQRLAWARRVRALWAYFHDRMGQWLHGQGRKDAAQPMANGTLRPAECGQLGVQAAIDGQVDGHMGGQVEDLDSLEASLVAADLVICQTGCLSHGAYWRVHDHCKRTGKACVLVDQHDAVRIVRVHKLPACGTAAQAACEHEKALP